jgi:hypothetical protein
MKFIYPFLALLFFSGLVFSQTTNSLSRKASTVSKYSIKFDKDTKKQVSSNSELDEKVKQSPFNLNYGLYLKSNASNKNFNALLTAYSLDSSNSELYFELAKYYEITNNLKSKKIFCLKLKSTKLTAALNEYAYNTLMSVEQNGILVTYGEKDTYPIWILQTLENIRTDVKILNYDLLVNSSYRKRIQKELGLKFSSSYSQPVDILRDVAEKNTSKPIYYSLTISHLILKELKSNLFSTGLALKYSKKKFDNIPVLKTNWETKFKKTNMVSSRNMESDKQLHLNYVLPLLQLSSYYKENSRSIEHQQINNTILMLGKRADKLNQVKALLNK